MTMSSYQLRYSCKSDGHVIALILARSANDSCNMHTGLMGGHSGLNINEDRGNAVRFAARIADTVLRAAPGAKLAGIAGGDKRNAIPREATATVLVCISRYFEIEHRR